MDKYIKVIILNKNTDKLVIYLVYKTSISNKPLKWENDSHITQTQTAKEDGVKTHDQMTGEAETGVRHLQAKDTKDC